MTNSTNWPNPERPGVPLFPERDGWHMVNCAPPTRHTIFRFWFSREKMWHIVGRKNLFHNPYSGSFGFPPDMFADNRYIGPVLSPAQIAEMLVAERERCAKVCEDAYEKSGRDFEYLGCNDAAQQIRNLGAAP
ncbi:hypothetical protein [Acetobacter sp.]|uniref:hypothetical protein n=1 Tax=Acetobacter sp. TaxID=440 RepID=UPI002590DD61|nr:hypothetical protein [Acetobacter sp.]MCC6105936.1 hypothetical protein [Acetobacter sp.]